MNWNIYSYGSGDFLRLVFNGIASIFGNADYAQAMSISALIGFLGVMLLCAFDKAALNNFKWLVGIIFLYQIAVVPKQTVIITDRVIPANSAVVQNVPLGLAMTAGFFSSISDYLTRTFETVFSLPNGFRYSTSGMLFGHRLLDASREANIPQERTYLNFSDFFSTCIVVDGIGHNRFTWEDVMKSGDLVTFFSNKPAINAASFLYRNSSGSASILPCRSGFTDYLKPDLQNLSASVIARMATSFVGQTGSSANASSKISSEMQTVLNYLTGVNKTANTNAIQFALTNAITGGLTTISKQVNDSNTLLGLVLARSEVERQATYKAMGVVAGEKLPLLRGLFEAFIYAIFPIVILMALVVPTKVPLAYVKTLAWINLWPPLYALINFAVQYHSKGALTDIATLSGGFSAIANTKMQLYVSDIADTAGYMASSIPIIAWMFVSGSGALASSLADRVMKGYDTSVQKGAEEVTKGEGQFAGVKWQQTADGHMQTSYMNDLGTQTTRAGGGQEFISQAQSSSPVAIQAMKNVAAVKQEELSRAIQNEEKTAAQVGQTNTALLSDSASLMNKVANSDTATEADKSAVSEAKQIQQQNIMSAAEKYQKDHNVKFTTGTQLALSAEAKAKAGLDVFGNGATLEGSAKLSHDMGKIESDDYKMAQDFMKSQQFAEAMTKNASIAHEVAKQHGISSEDAGMNGLSSDLQNQTSAMQSHSKAVGDVTSAKEAYSQAETISSSLNINNTDALIQGLHKTGMDTASIDHLFRDAGNGNQTAVQALSEKVTQMNLMGGLDKDFFDKHKGELATNQALNGMKTEGDAGVDSYYQGGTNSVDAVNQSNQTAVVTQQPKADPSAVTVTDPTGGVQPGKPADTVSDDVERIHLKSRTPIPGVAVADHLEQNVDLAKELEQSQAKTGTNN